MQFKYLQWSGAVLMLVASAMAGAASCEKVVISVGPDYPPLHWYDGKAFHGASIDIVSRVFADMHVPVEWRYVGPFARVLATAQAGKIDVIASLKMTPERKAFLAFSSSPAFNDPVAVFVARTRRFPYAGAADLVGHTGGMVIGTRFGEPLDTLVRTQLTIQQASMLDLNFKKLEMGRIDYLIAGYYHGTSYLQANRIADKFVALTPYVLQAYDHVAFVKASPCQRYQADFGARLARLVAAGETTRAIDTATEAWKKAPVVGH